MQLDTARSFLLVGIPLWIPSPSEGWDLFNLDHPLTGGIERCDETALFDDDEAAEAFVIAQAQNGSARHHIAMRIHEACNALRYHLWGPEWVDSRIGPPEDEKP